MSKGLFVLSEAEGPLFSGRAALAIIETVSIPPGLDSEPNKMPAMRII
jgi:hypothetical protein